uniref:FBD domain-containing protein n=1 Tax=Panagrellus redivivus TaxID=6233 RepID=A0A7E4W873_PANRE
MPFPLLSLPYGFRRRLVELSTPFEAYSIQIAAPDFTPFCQPVKVPKAPDNDFSYLEIDGRNNQVCDKSDKAVTKGEYELHVLRHCLKAYNLTKMDIVLDYFILSHSSAMYFTSCHIDLTFVKKLRSNLHIKLLKNALFRPVLMFRSCTYDSSVTTSTLCNSFINHFRDLTFMPFPVLPEGVNGLLNANLTGLWYIKLGLTSLNMLDIDPNALLKFFLAQDDNFSVEMHLQFYKPDAKIKEKVDAMLSNNFEPIVVLPRRSAVLPLTRLLYIHQSGKPLLLYKFIKKE